MFVIFCECECDRDNIANIRMSVNKREESPSIIAYSNVDKPIM